SHGRAMSTAATSRAPRPRAPPPVSSIPSSPPALCRGELRLGCGPTDWSAPGGRRPAPPRGRGTRTIAPGRRAGLDWRAEGDADGRVGGIRGALGAAEAAAARQRALPDSGRGAGRVNAPHPLLARMRGDVPGELWPPVFGHERASLAALLFALDRTQWSTPEEIAAGQARQFALLVRHFARHSSRFRARMAAAGLDPRVLDLARVAELPPLARREVQAAGSALYCPTPPAHAPVRIGQTSGSTGGPVRIAKGRMCQLMWLAMSVRWHLWQEPDPMARRAAVRVLVERDAVEHKDWGGAMAALFETGPLLVLNGGLDLADQ